MVEGLLAKCTRQAPYHLSHIPSLRGPRESEREKHLNPQLPRMEDRCEPRESTAA